MSTCGGQAIGGGGCICYTLLCYHHESRLKHSLFPFSPSCHSPEIERKSVGWKMNVFFVSNNEVCECWWVLSGFVWTQYDPRDQNSPWTTSSHSAPFCLSYPVIRMPRWVQVALNLDSSCQLPLGSEMHWAGKRQSDLAYCIYGSFCICFCDFLLFMASGSDSAFG